MGETGECVSERVTGQSRVRYEGWVKKGESVCGARTGSELQNDM